ncbi:ABC transporter permease [Glaciihabitans sp. UYNi722]|uniref:ABC transporter permease n=1 Tax=Glaciihabitans sp. UYNi722 TaxID=3156344 RepID=UPI00339341E9
MQRFSSRLSPQIVSVLGVIVIVIVIFSILSPGFLALGNVSNLLLQASSTAIAASGMTLVIMAGWIDLSIGSLMSLAVTIALAAAGVTSAAYGSSSIWTYFIVIGVSIAGGALNGVLIWALKVQPLLVTLGTMTIFSGIALHITSAGNRSASGPIQYLGRAVVFGIPLPVIVAVVVVVVIAFLLRRTPFGRYVTAIGGSERSARETGLPINRLRIVVFAISGLCAGIAGIITVGQVGTMQSTFGVGFEFTVITAVVVGGTSLTGGKGSVIGSALGAILLTLIDNGLNRVNASVYIYDVITGLVLLVAVLTDSVVMGRIRRMNVRIRQAGLERSQKTPST